MNLSNGRCHLCQIRDNDETMQHLFFECPSVNKIIKEIEAIFNRSGLTANIEIKALTHASQVVENPFSLITI
jgi:hypothetical protein